MRKMKTGDEVIVIAGKDKGKRGTITRIITDQGRVIVENVNIIKRHVKPNPAKGIAGGIMEQEAALQLSNVMLYNPQSDKGERVGIRTLEDGRKVRYFKSTGEVVDA
ncbi:MAG: 50S ribosomal protein L24 [Gammaproteobacteria bacterium]|nr:50S ribosomal protein L24 [Gammaproteobacteria bacterium]